MTRIEVRHGSLTDVEADCDVLVNASNTILALGSGVSGAIRRACGPGFQDALDRLLDAQAPDGLEPGAVVMTDAGAHPRAKWIAHVAVMDFRKRAERVHPTMERIRIGSEALWPAIEGIDLQALSVAMVVLGAGTGGLGLRASATTSCVALAAHLAATPTSRIARVVFHGYDEIEYANLFDEVGKHFPLDAATIPAELRGYVDAVRE